MTLILNNIKGLGIHLLMSIFSVLLVLMAIMLSPIYGSKWIAILTLVCLYLVYIGVYIKLSYCLKLESHKRNDYLVGILSLIIGVGIWGLAVYYSQCTMSHISEEVSAYWAPYNVYIFPSWPLLYGQKKPFILLLGSLSPGVLLTVGMKIRRKRRNVLHNI